MTTEQGRSPDVDAFVEQQREPFRAALEELRSVIHGAAPGAGERVAYGIPVVTFEGRNLVGFNAAKDHYTLQLMSTAPIDEFHDELADYRTGAGSIQFDPREDLPRDLVERLVRARIAENAERAAKRSG